MEALSSRALRKEMMASQQASVEELYDGKGFFFRQRRGRLNLRRVEAIDVERMIREVDIDILQQIVEDLTFSEFGEDDLHFLSDRQVVKLFKLAQLTIEYLLYSQGKLVANLNELSKKYSSKKRSLYRKRKEMAGLKEETTSLHSQLKAKRRNLHTLEKLLKDANRNKELSHLEEEKSSKKQSTITFMVAFPDGTFIELMEAPETTVRRIITEMKHALLIDNARGNNTADNCISDLNKPFKLFFKGKLLYNDATLDQCGLRNGDTILFAPDHKAAPEPTPQLVRKEVIMQESQSPNIDGVMDVIREQMECMKKLTDEVNQWSQVLKDTARTEVDKLTAHESKLIDHVDDRLKAMELEITENLKRLRELETQRPVRGNQTLIFGDLENDRDDYSSAINEINLKISRSVTKIDSLDSQFGNTSMSIAELKALIADQQEQVRELRRLLLERSQQGPAPSIIVNQTIPKQKPATIVKMEKSEVNVKSNKWNDYSYTLPSAQEQAPIVAKQQETVVIEQVYSPPPKPKVVPKEIVPTPAAVVSAPAQKPQAAAETPVARPPSPKEMKLDTPPTPLEAPEPKDPNRLYIDFSAKFNKDLRILSLEKFTVGLELDWNADDTVLEIRKELSRQAKVPYSCAALTMDGQLVKLAMDLDPQLPFSPEDVKEYAELGRLGVKVNRMNVVSNPQIDLFVPAWERSAGVANSSELGKFAKTRRSYPEEELFESDSKDNRKKAKPAMYSTVRTSLDKLMVSVQDKAGLTDDELERKRSDLENYSSASDSEHFRKYRSSLATAVGAITAESGSESAAEDYLRTSVRKSRDVRDSSDLTLLQFRLNANDRSLDASTVHSSLMRRSARHFYEDGEPEEAKRSWNDELPMLSSLNGPLNFANQRINQPEEDKRPERVSTNSHRSRYDEEPSPSYISSLNSRDMSYMIASKASNDPNFSRTGFSEAENGNHRHPYGRDSYSSIGAGFDNSLTLTSTLPDGLDFSTTIDSEGDMLLKNRAAVVNEKEIKRRADAYEREAATMPFDSHDNSNNTSELRKSGGSIESPFKEFRGHNTSMTAADLEGENGSDHSFALSDSNNMD